MPGKTFAVKRDKYTGGKFSNDQVLVGRNADGTDKIILLVISKSQNPHCLKVCCVIMHIKSRFG